MDNEVVLSIIIPAYNSEKYIYETLESIAKQKFKKYEIIIVDDGSEDNTADICKKFIDDYRDIDVTYLYQQNKGVSSARNNGLNSAKGIYIHFVDSDDLVLDDMYSNFAEIAVQYNPDIIMGGVCIEKENKSENFAVDSDVYYKNYSCVTNFLKEIDIDEKEWMLNVLWNKWFRKDIIDQEHLKFKIICPGEDYDFIIQYFCNVNKLYISKQIVYKYLLKTSGSLISSKYNYDSQIKRRNVIWDQTQKLLKHRNFNNINFDISEGKAIYSALYSSLNGGKKEGITYKINIVQNFIDETYFRSVVLFIQTKKGKLKKIERLIFQSNNALIIAIYLCIKQKLQYKVK